MSLAHVECPSIVLPNTGTESTAYDLRKVLQDSDRFTLMAPAATEAGTIQLSHDGTTWFTWHTGAADVAYPAAGKARDYEVPPANFMKLVIGAATFGADRTIRVFKRMWAS